MKNPYVIWAQIVPKTLGYTASAPISPTEHCVRSVRCDKLLVGRRQALGVPERRGF